MRTRRSSLVQSCMRPMRSTPIHPLQSLFPFLLPFRAEAKKKKKTTKKINKRELELFLPCLGSGFFSSSSILTFLLGSSRQIKPSTAQLPWKCRGGEPPIKNHNKRETNRPTDEEEDPPRSNGAFQANGERLQPIRERAVQTDSFVNQSESSTRNEPSQLRWNVKGGITRVFLSD